MWASCGYFLIHPSTGRCTFRNTNQYPSNKLHSNYETWTLPLSLHIILVSDVTSAWRQLQRVRGNVDGDATWQVTAGWPYSMITDGVHHLVRLNVLTPAGQNVSLGSIDIVKSNPKSFMPFSPLLEAVYCSIEMSFLGQNTSVSRALIHEPATNDRDGRPPSCCCCSN